MLPIYGGPDGELAASMRYLSQRYTMPYREISGLLTDIGSEASKYPPKQILYMNNSSIQSNYSEN